MRAAVVVLAAGCAFQPGLTGSAGGGGGSDAARIRGDAPADADSLTLGLIAWYRMESIAGSEAIDSTGNGHTGTCTSCPTVVTAHIGNGFSFDGTTRIDVLDGTDFETASGFSVAAWVKYAAGPSGYGCPAGKTYGTANLNSWQLCWTQVPAQWSFYSVHDETGTFDTLADTPAPTVGGWYHTVMTWDGATKEFWVDGVSGGTMAASIIWDNARMTLGADYDYGGQSSVFQGVMDDVRIYSRVLTHAEIARLASQ